MNPILRRLLRPMRFEMLEPEQTPYYPVEKRKWGKVILFLLAMAFIIALVWSGWFAYQGFVSSSFEEAGAVLSRLCA